MREFDRRLLTHIAVETDHELVRDLAEYAYLLLDEVETLRKCLVDACEDFAQQIVRMDAKAARRAQEIAQTYYSRAGVDPGEVQK